jgi:hypothetical protein
VGVKVGVMVGVSVGVKVGVQVAGMGVDVGGEERGVSSAKLTDVFDPRPQAAIKTAKKTTNITCLLIVPPETIIIDWGNPGMIPRLSCFANPTCFLLKIPYNSSLWKNPDHKGGYEHPDGEVFSSLQLGFYW